MPRLIAIVLSVCAIAALARCYSADAPRPLPPPTDSIRATVEERGESSAIPGEPALVARDCPDWLTAEGVTCIAACDAPPEDRAVLESLGAKFDCPERAQ